MPQVVVIKIINYSFENIEINKLKGYHAARTIAATRLG